MNNLGEDVLNGARPQLPHNRARWPNGFYELMCECWDGDPAKRPTFAVIEQRLAEMVGTLEGM